ncbi:ADP-ribosylation/crystallin J1 [Singulisphaera rosea]
MSDATILYRPVGPKELLLIEESGWTAFPPRLPEQPIFYPVTNEEYAVWISKNWNVRDYGAGYVTRFAVNREFADRYPIRRVGAGHAEELWVPADELAEFNQSIQGKIEVIAEFRAEPGAAEEPSSLPK